MVNLSFETPSTFYAHIKKARHTTRLFSAAWRALFGQLSAIFRNSESVDCWPSSIDLKAPLLCAPRFLGDCLYRLFANISLTH